MSRTLIAALWTSAALMSTAIAAPAAAELGQATPDPHDRMADWFDFSIDDDVFAQSIHGPFGFQPAANPTAGVTAFLGGAATIGEVSVRPYSSLTHTRPYEDSLGVPAASFAGRGSLIGVIGLQTSGRFDTGMGALETLIDLYLAHELDIDGVRFKTLPGALSRNIYSETVDPAKFDFENALSFRLKGMVPGYFQYETRVRVRSTGLREVTGAIRFRW